MHNARRVRDESACAWAFQTCDTLAVRCVMRARAASARGNGRMHTVLYAHGGTTTMSKILRGLAAGWGAKKLGGGCFSTVLVFLLLWWLLGNFGVFE